MSHDRHLVVFSGAGLSADSGIATFRGPHGLWENTSIDEVCNFDTWEEHRESVHRFYNARQRVSQLARRRCIRLGSTPARPTRRAL